jgi:hypothetical protein
MVHAYPPPREKLNAMRAVRSTIIVSGLQALRERGHYEAWSAAVDPAARDAILTTIAGVWLPMDLVMAHYRACEALHLSHDEAFALGNAVGHRIHDTMLLMVRRVANELGVTPWTIGAQYDRLFSRVFDGGGFRILREGPKDAVIELFQIPPAQFSYFRSAFCGVNQAGLALFAQRGFVRLVKEAATEMSFAIRVQWV